MRTRPEDLLRKLDQGLAPVYLVFGEEPLQIEESLDAIRAAARKAGFSERVALHVEQGFDWSALREHRDTLSLFGDRKIVDLRMSSGPGREGAEPLCGWAEAPNPDVLLLLTAGKLERKSTGTKWFKAIDAAGVTVQTHPVEPARLPDWVTRRAASAGVPLTPDAARLLAERNEGNLLALSQEIAKARLLRPPGDAPLDAESLLDAVSDSARFGAFDLVDATLAGDAVRALRILQTLRQEGLQPLGVLGPLVWGLRAAARMRTLVGEGRSLDQAMREARAFGWQRKQAIVRKALDRHDSRGWHRILGAAGRADRVAKGAAAGRPWDELERLCLLACGRPAA